MWCIGVLNDAYRQRMYALLELYARPLSRAEPVICIDEKSTQLIGHSREPLPMTVGKPAKQDYEYVRNGTTNLLSEVQAWQQARNADNRTIVWSFTRQEADRKLGRHYVSKLTC